MEGGRESDDAPVLAPEAEHVSVVGARLDRLEALERRHGVAEQEPAFMRCALPESARVERFDDQNGSRERGTFVRRAETGRERFRVRGVGWGDGLTAGSWRGAPPTCRPAASEMPAGCGSGSPEVPGPPRVVPPSKPPALLVAEVEWGSRVSQSRGAVAAGWRWSRGGGGGEGRKGREAVALGVGGKGRRRLRCGAVRPNWRRDGGEKEISIEAVAVAVAEWGWTVPAAWRWGSWRGEEE